MSWEVDESGEFLRIGPASEEAAAGCSLFLAAGSG